MKIKEFINKLLNIPKELFKRFPESISLSILISIILAVFLENDIMEDIIIFLIIFPMEILFSEIYFKDNKKLRIISFIISIIIAIICNKYILERNSLIIKLTIVYSIILIILGLIKLLKDSKLPFNEYLTRVSSTSFKAQIITSILSSGLMLISLIIVLLFKVSEMLIIRAEILFFGIFVVPVLLYIFSNTSEKVWDFIKFVIKNLSSYIVIISFLVIYIYMLKIFITWNIPSNHIFRITSLLFILGLPIWTMVTSFEKESLPVKICSKLPIAFIPFIGLQIYSLTVRIMDSGITVIRYIGIMLIILEIIYVIIYLIKEEKVYYLGYVIILMSIIGILIPKINATSASVSSQYKRVINYLNKENLSNKEYNELYSAYIYLETNAEGKSYINKLTKEQINYITDGHKEDYVCYSNEGIQKYSNIDIRGYNKLSEFAISDYQGNQSFDVFKNVKIGNYNVNISTEIKRFIESQKSDEDMKVSNTIVTDEYKITITNIDICLNNNKIDNYSVSGYILEK